MQGASAASGKGRQRGAQEVKGLKTQSGDDLGHKNRGGDPLSDNLLRRRSLRPRRIKTGEELSLKKDGGNQEFKLEQERGKHLVDSKNDIGDEENTPWDPKDSEKPVNNEMVGNNGNENCAEDAYCNFEDGLEHWSYINCNMEGRIETNFSDEQLAQAYRVKTLNLQGNQITCLNGLADFQSLRQLNLASNDIPKISAMDLAGLDHLVILSLASNLLEAIPAGSFPPLRSLRELDLSYNVIDDIEGLSVLESLGVLNLRQNKMNTVLSLSPLRLCQNLKSLWLRDNPLSTTQSLGEKVSALLPQIEKTDAEESIKASAQREPQDAPPASSDSPVELPRFERAAERFFLRMQRTHGKLLTSPESNSNQVRMGESSPNESSRALDEKNSGFHSNPWSQFAKTQTSQNDKRIVHTRILRQRMLTEAQRIQLVNDWCGTQIECPRRPSEVLLEWSGQEALSRSIDLEDLEFQDLLRSARVQATTRQIHHLRHAGLCKELKVGHFVECLVILRHEVSQRYQRQQQELQSICSEESSLDSPHNAKDKANSVSSPSSNSDPQKFYTKSESQVKGAVDGTPEIDHNRNPDAPVESTDTNDEQKGSNAENEQPSTEPGEEKDDHIAEVQLQNEVCAPSSQHASPASAQKLETIQPNEVCRESGIGAQQYLLSELSMLRQRLDSQENQVWKQRLDELERNSSQVCQRMLGELESRMEDYQKALMNIQTEKETELASAQKEARTRIAKLEHDLEVCNTSLLKSEQDNAMLSERLETCMASRRALKDRLDRYQEAHSQTQNQLIARADELVSKLALAESRREEYAAQARDRSVEATALEQRLGVVLSESQQLRQELLEQKENSKTTQAHWEKENQMLSTRLQTAEEQIHEITHQLRITQKALHNEREKSSHHDLRVQRSSMELHNALGVVREQKQKLEKMMDLLRIKDEELKKTHKSLNDMSKKHAEEASSLELEMRSLERRIKDIDELRADALRAQAERDATKEECRRLTLTATSERERIARELDEARAALKVKDTMLRDQNETIEELRRKATEDADVASQLQMAEDRILELKSQLQETQDTIDEQEGIIESYEESAREQEDVPALRKDLERKSSALEQAAKEMEQFRDLVEHRDSKLADQVEHIKILETSLKETRELLATTQTKLENEEKTLLEEKARHIEKVHKLQSRYDEVIASNHSLQGRLDLTKQSEVDLQAQIKRWRATAAELRHEIQVLGRALEQERGKNTRNVAKFEKFILDMRSG